MYNLVATTLMALTIAADAIDDRILEAVDAVRAPGATFAFDLDVETTEGEDTRHVSFAVRVREMVKSLVIYKAPEEDAGKTLLMVGDNLWIHIPGSRQPIRISPRQRLLGPVSGADVARVVFRRDYRVTATKSSQGPSGPELALTLEATTDGAAYQKIELTLDAATYRPREGDFFALSGKRLKTIRYDDYIPMAGASRPSRLTIVDHLVTGRTTVMRYSNMRLTDTPAAHFQKSFLDRAGWTY
jgi:hypothetical protein